MDSEDVVNLDVLTDDFDGCSDVDDDGDYEFINEGTSGQLSAGSEFYVKSIYVGSVGSLCDILTNPIDLLSAKFWCTKTW